MVILKLLLQLNENDKMKLLRIRASNQKNFKTLISGHLSENSPLKRMITVVLTILAIKEAKPIQSSGSNLT